MDAFSEILSGVKLNGAVFFTAEFSAPWGFSAPASNVMAAMVAPGAAHLVLYHLVIEGGAVVEMPDGQSIELKPGDVVIFPHGDPHHMSSGKGRPAAISQLWNRRQDQIARLEPFARGRRRRDFPVRVRVHDLRSLPQPAYTQRTSARL